MKFETLGLENFRQFAGHHELHFPQRDNKNVLLLYGANGAGKTTLLNAITWCLYGATTDALEDPRSLVSIQALEQEAPHNPVTSTVTCTFRHEGERFIVTRSVEAKYSGADEKWVAGEPRLKVTVIRTDGQADVIGSKQPATRELLSQRAVELVLPQSLFGYFLFDGERIERLTRRGGSQEIAKAVENLLGLKVVERGVRHLRQHVRSALNEELGKYGDSDLQTLISGITAQQSELDDVLGRKKQHEENVAQFQTDEDEVNRRFLELKETHDLQTKLNAIKEEEKQLRVDGKQREVDLRDLINTRGFLAFVPGVAKMVCGLVADHRQKGRIPALYQERFIQDLLEDKTCICGTKLEQGSEHYNEVSALLLQGASSDAQTRAIEIASLSETLGDRRDDFMEAVRQAQKGLRKNDEALQRVVQAIAALEEQQSSTVNTGEVQSLSHRREGLKGDIAAANQEIGRLNGDIKKLGDEISQLEKKREKAEVTDEKGKQVQKRLSVEAETSSFLEKLLALRKEEVRTAIDRRVKETYNAITYKPYDAELTGDYNLRLVNEMGSGLDSASYEVAKSTGENQVLSLSFIGSVAAYARTVRERKNDDLGFPGGIYPLVMDSPFGNLDENYRKKVAEFLPAMANQVSMLVSKSQGSQEVLDQLSGRVGKAYVLHFKTPKVGATTEVVSINGKDYPYISQTSDEYESVEIVEVIS